MPLCFEEFMKLPVSIENLLERLWKNVVTDKSSLRRGDCSHSGGQEVVQGSRTCQAHLKFLREASSPLSQLILQAHIAEAKGSVLTAADVLVHVKRLVGVLEGNGVTILGQPGEDLPYDPSRHEAVDMVVSGGTPVCIRFPGLEYGGVVVRKALVELKESN